MARDLNRLLQDLRTSRDVFITADGNVEDADEARQNAAAEEQREGEAKPRTRLKPEVFGGGDAPVFVRMSVIDAMHAEAARHLGETGGILVGPKSRTVTEIIFSGPEARRTSASYELDVEHLQPLLEAAEKRGLSFLGIWHSHPEGYAELSGTDRKAARSILGDPDWGVSELLLPLSVRSRGSFETHFFLAEGDNAHVVTARPILCSGTSNSTIAPPASTAGPWALHGSFLDTPFGRARIEEDRTALETAKWKVSLRQGTDIVLVAEREPFTIYCVLPREYPFSPPDIFRSTGGTVRDIGAKDLPELVSWSSQRSVAQVVDEASLLPSKGTPIRTRFAGVKSMLRAVLSRRLRAAVSSK